MHGDLRERRGRRRSRRTGVGVWEFRSTRAQRPEPRSKGAGESGSTRERSTTVWEFGSTGTRKPIRMSRGVAESGRRANQTASSREKGCSRAQESRGRWTAKTNSVRRRRTFRRARRVQAPPQTPIPSSPHTLPTPILPHNRRRLVALLVLLGVLALLAGTGRPTAALAALPLCLALPLAFRRRASGGEAFLDLLLVLGLGIVAGIELVYLARFPGRRRLVPDEHAVQVLGAGMALPGAGRWGHAAGRVGRVEAGAGVARAARASRSRSLAGGRSGLPGCRRAWPRRGSVPRGPTRARHAGRHRVHDRRQLHVAQRGTRHLAGARARGDPAGCWTT